MQPGTSGMGRTPVPRAWIAGAAFGLTGGTTAPDIIYIKLVFCIMFRTWKGCSRKALYA